VTSNNAVDDQLGAQPAEGEAGLRPRPRQGAPLVALAAHTGNSDVAKLMLNTGLGAHAMGVNNDGASTAYPSFIG